MQKSLKKDSTGSPILVVCHAWYGDTIGGSFRLASEFAAYLASQGHKVDYACCAKDLEQLSNSEEAGVRIFRYRPPGPRLPGPLKLRSHLRSCARLIRNLSRSVNYRAASLHSPLQGNAAIQVLRGSQTYINYTVHSPFDDEISGNHQRLSILKRLAVRQARRIDRKNCEGSDVVQCDSRYTLDVFVRKYGRIAETKGLVAPGWVDAQAFGIAPCRSDFRRQLPAAWDTDGTVFFTLRRLENRMGLDTLVEASRLLKERGYKFRTLIAGGGSLRQSLQDQIDRDGLQDQVKLLGRLPEEQLPLAYGAADCFVLPTRALECFGLIVLEAFACNTPVIASSVAAIPELAERQGREWMFEPGNATQLADRMQAFLDKRLQPTVDLRAIAMEYDKPKILKEWERVLLSRQ